DGIRDRNVTGVQTCALPISDQDQRESKDEFHCRHRIWKRSQRHGGCIAAVAHPLSECENAGGSVESQREDQAVAKQLTKEASLRSEERRVGKGCRKRGGEG